VTRPAAIEQLERLAKEIKIDYFQTASMKPLERAQAAIKYAQTYGLDFVIVDTAGRLSIDEALMSELSELKTFIQPHHILYVADAMSGQAGVSVAEGFSKRVGLTGAVLSKADADTRGGIAFSIREALQVPLQFVGTGEKPDAFEPFHPDRWISRILGMGDIASLAEKAKEIAEEEGIDDGTQVKKILKGQLSLVDFQQQMKMMKKMGSLGNIMGMIPGMSQMAGKIDQDQVDKKLKKVDAMINSMTNHERERPDVLNGDRKRRIAKGSGTQVEDLNQFLREFNEMQKLMKRMGSFKGLMRGGLGFPR
jgi:signal recognition particle subunit SRP54